jgi:hypothetical protein
LPHSDRHPRRQTHIRLASGAKETKRENCGGIPSFYELLEAFADPAHPNHALLKEWTGNYNANSLNELPIKYALGRIANRRNAAKARVSNKKAPRLGCLTAEAFNRTDTN